jgi:hypothetical protein
MMEWIRPRQSGHSTEMCNEQWAIGSSPDLNLLLPRSGTTAAQPRRTASVRPFFLPQRSQRDTEREGDQTSLEAHSSVHFAANCVFESTHVEVDPPPDFAPAQLEVGQPTGKHDCDGFALRFSVRVFRDAAPLCPSVASVVRRMDGRRPCDVVAHPPGGRPTLNLQLSSRRFGWGSAALGPLW